MATTHKTRPITIKQQKRMKISHINTIQNPKFIIVRQYNNSIVTLPSNEYFTEDIATGVWKLREDVFIIPKEYKQLNKIQWVEKQKE